MTEMAGFALVILIVPIVVGAAVSDGMQRKARSAMTMAVCPFSF